MKRQMKENEREADIRRGPFGQGPRAFAKVVERVTDRLHSRLAREREHSAATTLTDAVEKAWREAYARPLPTLQDVDRRWSSVPRRMAKKKATTKPRVPKAKPKPSRRQEAPELSPGKLKKRFVLKTQTSSSRKCKRARPSGNNVSAEDCDSSVVRSDVDHGTRPQESTGGGGAEAGRKSDLFRARDCEKTGDGECGRGDTGTATGHNPPGREDGGVSTGEADAGDGDDHKRQEADHNPERREDGEAFSPGQQVSDKTDADKEPSGADARPGDEGHAKDETDKASAPPDVTVTANFVGELKKGTRYKRKRWKLELEGGAIETNQNVFVFDKCECTFLSPWK